MNMEAGNAAGTAVWNRKDETLFKKSLTNSE